MFTSAKQRLDSCGIPANKNYKTLAMYVNHNVNSLKTDNAIKIYLLNKVEALLNLDKQGFQCLSMRDTVIVSDDNQKDNVLEITMLKHGKIRYENIVVNAINPDIVKALIA